MGIFSGVEIMFFFLGVLSTLGIFGIYWAVKKFNPGWPMAALLSTGFFLILFSLAWSTSSILEHEHQAANMGLLFFGLPGILCLGFVWKKMPRNSAMEAKSE